MATKKHHVLVIGAGISGLTAALRLVETDNRVTLISKGIGALPLSPGSLDVLGYVEDALVTDPLAALGDLPAWHPYQHIGAKNIESALAWLVGKVPELYPAVTPAGSLHNSLLPTALGAVRPALVPPLTMQNAVLRDGMSLLVVGIEQFKDFPAALIADNLARSPRVKLQVRAASVSLDARGLADVKGTDYARGLDADPQLMHTLAERINAVAKPGETVLLPAIIGLKPATFSDFAALVHNPVAEVPTPPPCVPGRRLNDALMDLAMDARVDIRNNAQVVGVNTEDGRIVSVRVARAGGEDTLKVDAVVDAAGGFSSGNLSRDSHLGMHEGIFDLPLFTPQVSDKTGIHAIATRQDTLVEQLLSTGILVNAHMQPLQASEDGGELDTVAWPNLYAIGEVLGGANPASEISGEGLALGSMWIACEAINAGKGEAK